MTAATVLNVLPLNVRLSSANDSFRWHLMPALTGTCHLVLFNLTADHVHLRNVCIILVLCIIYYYDTCVMQETEIEEMLNCLIWFVTGSSKRRKFRK